VAIDGQVTSTVAAGEYGHWRNNLNATLAIGNFEGWVDEVKIICVISE
tara:strand:+ start:6334 stop:6477 length:144 start_codon:yes stop_codon:yes gene_type:complete